MKREQNFSEAFRDVILVDEKENLKVQGEYGYFDRNTNRSFITKDVLFAQGSEEDDTLYLVCDTLLLQEENDSNKSFLPTGTLNFFQAEMQGSAIHLLTT